MFVTSTLLTQFELTNVFHVIILTVCAFSSTPKIWISSNPKATSTVSVLNKLKLKLLYIYVNELEYLFADRPGDIQWE